MTNTHTAPEGYTWSQTLAEVTVTLAVPAGTTGRQVAVTFSSTAVSAGLRGATPLLAGDLTERVVAGDCTWSLEDGRLLVLELAKANKMQWWKAVVRGHAEIDTTKIEPEATRLDDLDGEARAIVEKMMFDQRQRQMGQPTSDELRQQDAMARFRQQHPELDFSALDAAAVAGKPFPGAVAGDAADDGDVA